MSLPKTARAAVVAEYGQPIEIRELPVPDESELEPGALLVRVDVASICGSDVHQWDGMTQALAPASLICTPSPVFPEIVLRAPAAVPPITLPETLVALSPMMETPLVPLPCAVVPLVRNPM